MTLDWQRIHSKWQQEWKEDRIFQVEVDDLTQKKYYITTPYPYMSGLLHLGHLFTYMAPEVTARFKRMQGHNVLFKFAFHCTGTPIVAAAQRVREGEPTQIATLKKMGITDAEISKFAKPEYWCDYFPRENLKDLHNMGFAIDERYTFKTTHLDPPYDKFVSWQFNKLHTAGYVKKGKHPVMWCPKDNVPVGDHDRAEGEGETPQEFLLFKHKLVNVDTKFDNKTYVITATLRQDTVLGITNLYVHPDLVYAQVKVGDETWIMSDESAKRFAQQGNELHVLGSITGRELIGKTTEEFDHSKVLILPATFVQSSFGTGIVHSVPSDSADDLIALWDLQKDEKTMHKYGLDVVKVKAIKPIPVLDTPELGPVAAQAMLEKYQIKSQADAEKLATAKQELYKLSHHTATFNEKYKSVFSQNLVGKRVEEGKSVIRKDLLDNGFAVVYYQATGKVVCRCLTPCIIKVVSNQWFLTYENEAWKEITHECLNGTVLYPQKVRKQFEYVLDWLQHWACTREFGLGTKLPWDHAWVIESLSDSTLQMAYCTIAKYLEHPATYGFSVDQLNDGFFDYVFLGKGNLIEIEKSTKVPRAMIEKMRKEFEYWYPFDFRNSAKDLLQNHLAFCLFNHTAIFPKKYWPKAYVLNGRIMVNNEKMSKSKGNFFTIRELYERHTADIIRLTAANAGEGVEDANYDMTFLETAKNKLSDVHDFALEHYNKGRSDILAIDSWFENTIQSCVQKATDSLENMLFKSAVQAGFLDMQRYLKWYTRRTNGKYNKKIITLFIEAQLKLLAPFTPHFCEEVWQAIGKKTYISNETWPAVGAINSHAALSEELVEQTLGDVTEVLKLAKTQKPSSMTFFVSENWKYDAFSEIGKQLSVTREFKEIMGAMMKQEEYKKYSGELTKLLPKFIKAGSVPSVTSPQFELKVLQDAIGFFENEFSCKVNVVRGEDSSHPKAKAALPGKVGIVVE